MIRPFSLDVHTHLGATRGFRARFGAADDLIRLMDASGTRLAIFVSMGLLDQQFDLGYREALAALERYPDRLRAYTVFDPNWPDVSLKLMEQYQDHPGFVGVKIHPAAHLVAPDDPRYRDCWAFANERRLVVLAHTWSPDPAKPAQDLSTPDRFAPTLAGHPGLRLILGHCGGREIGQRLAVEVLQQYDNCWADLSGDTFALGQVEWLVDQAGADKLLYGTDANWIEPRYLLGHILKAKITPEARAKIFYGNALRVFGDAINKFSNDDK